jgi:hypothetical protein
MISSTLYVLPVSSAGIDSLAIDLPMLLDMFGLPEFGRYTFMLSIDGEPKAGVQIAVRQGQAQLT